MNSLPNAMERFGGRQPQSERNRSCARLHNNSMKISEKLVQAYGTVTDALEKYGKPAFHYGLIPLIIVVGMTVKQDGRRPTLAQLLSPM